MTIEDESGEVQCVLWPRVFARSRQALRGPVLLVTGAVARWDGTTTLASSASRARSYQGVDAAGPRLALRGDYPLAAGQALGHASRKSGAEAHFGKVAAPEACKSTSATGNTNSKV